MNIFSFTNELCIYSPIHFHFLCENMTFQQDFRVDGNGTLVCFCNMNIYCSVQDMFCAVLHYFTGNDNYLHVRYTILHTSFPSRCTWHHRQKQIKNNKHKKQSEEKLFNFDKLSDKLLDDVSISSTSAYSTGIV